jgi:hypothetical protein
MILLQALPFLPEQPVEETVALPYTALAIGTSVFVLGLLLINYLTRSGTIARATTKEAIRQPVFLLMLALGLIVMVANYYVPFFSMGEDTKMYIDCGLATVLICSLIHAVWMASLSVADEIEGKTAMTLLSKPINRRQFVWGKYVGIFQSALVMIAIMGVTFFALTYFKYGYDQQEASQQPPPAVVFKSVAGLPFELPHMVEARYNVARTVFPGLALISMAVAVMTAVSVAISTRMPMLVNISTCFAIFVIGNLSPVLAQADVGNVFVTFFAGLLATVLPGLDHFNMSAAVSTGKNIPPDYIGKVGLYCVAYVTAAIMLAFLMFEDRDLA